MKAISLLQPWATLVVLGIKTIETRIWGTQHRGPILIHASKGKAGNIFALEPPFKKYIPDFKKLPFGAIIGQATITGVIRVEDLGMNDELINRLTMEEKAFGDYSEGRYAWVLEEAIQFDKPIPARGTLSIWEFPDENFNL
jgi:activating signal cointegrator 1